MDALRCQYASKPCEYTRSVKENGELHRLCAYHRARANDAQRRWHLRQRAGGVAATEIEPKTEVSERTKRRRRAAQAARERAALAGEPLPSRSRRVRTRPTKPQPLSLITANASPSWPPSVATAPFNTLLHTPLWSQSVDVSKFQAVDGNDPLSADDLALLDELMLCIEETTPMTTNVPPPVGGFFDSAWPPVTTCFSTGSAAHFV